MYTATAGDTPDGLYDGTNFYGDGNTGGPGPVIDPTDSSETDGPAWPPVNDTDGPACCEDACVSTLDCGAGLECVLDQCRDGYTWGFTSDACSECDARNGDIANDGIVGCMGDCTDHGDCGAGMFCCPNWSLCMDNTTYSTVGDNCDAFEALMGYYSNPPSEPSVVSPPTPVTDPSDPTEPEEADNYILQAEGTSCSTRDRLDYVGSVDECADLCEHLGSCHWFLYDDADGDCVQTDAHGCPNARLEKSLYDLYESVIPSVVAPSPSEDEDPYILIGENQRCSTGMTRYSTGNSLDECYHLCNNDDDCGTFVHDPNDGDCRRVHSAICPEPYLACSWCMMYQLNDAFEEVHVPEPETGSGPTVCAMRTQCGNRWGTSVGNQDSLEECHAAIEAAGHAFFHHDPSDGDCRGVSTSSCDCPEGTKDSSWFDFYMV